MYIYLSDDYIKFPFQIRTNNSPLDQLLINGCRTHRMERPDYFHTPGSKQELVHLLGEIGTERGMVKVIGGHHTWSNITSVTSRRYKGDRKTHLISLDRYNRVLDLDTENLTVRVQAGIRLWQLQQYLTERDLTLAQIGSIMNQSIAGVMSTGTHGTGLGFGIISTLVTEIELMTIGSDAKVQIHEINDHNNASLMSAARVSLGVLGVISEVRLRVAQQHYVHHVETPIPTEELLQDDTVEIQLHKNKFVKYWHLPHSGHTYRFITNPLPQNESLWTDRQRDLKGGLSRLFDWIDKRLLKTYLVNTVLRYSPESWTSFNANFMRRTSFVHYETVDTMSRCIVLRNDVPDHYEAEYIVPLRYWREMMRTLIDLEQRHFVNFIVELRFVRGDDILMSHAYGMGEHFAYFTFGISYSDEERARRYFTDAQKAAEQLADRHGFVLRVHWGKVLTLYEQGRLREHVKKTQPGFELFARIRAELDPLNVFVNDFHAQLFDIQL